MKDLNATKHIWLFMAREGGRWTGKELTDAMGDAIAGLHVQGYLTHMVAATQLVRWRNEGDKFVYGVTAACVPPRSVTVEELIDALIRFEENEKTALHEGITTPKELTHAD
jgi:hypothetical protein